MHARGTRSRSSSEASAGCSRPRIRREGMAAFLARPAPTAQVHRGKLDQWISTPTEEQLAVQKTARDFAHHEVAAQGGRDRQASTATPRSSSSGWPSSASSASRCPSSCGGSGLDHVVLRARDGGDRARVRLDRRDHVGQQLAGVRPDPAVRHRRAEAAQWLTPLASGKLLGCFALSEPEAGSDAAAQKTTAVRTATAGSSTAPRTGSPTARSPTSACCSR